MNTLVGDYVTLLRTALTCTVEAYWRVEPPLVLTCYVQPAEEGAEEPFGIGAAMSQGMGVDVFVETPWDDKVATAQAVGTTVETVKGVVAANRQLGAWECWGVVTGVGYFLASRVGASKPTYGARVRVSYTPPL